MLQQQPICDRINYYALTNTTAVIHGFEGIPQNLTINVVVFIILFLVFCFIRKIAWNYGRIALFSKFQTDTTDKMDYNVWKTVTKGDQLRESMSTEHEEMDEKTRLRRRSVSDITLQIDKGLFSWLGFFYTISDKDIREKAGSDAYQYLLFQRYLIFVNFVITLTSLTVILPINMHGNGTDIKYSEFATTTILNISSASSMIWVHAILSFVFFLGIICVIYHYVTRLKLTNIQEISSTLLIDGIPKQCSFRSIILDHFKEAYPDCEIKEIQFAHNVRKLTHLNLKREIAVHARDEAINQFLVTGFRREMVPRICGRMQSCCTEKVDVIQYYNDEILILEAEFQSEIIKAYENKIGVAFVTFVNVDDARKILEDYQAFCYMSNSPQSSSLSDEISSSYWTVSYAPHSNVIIWENLCHSYRKWYVKAFLINSIVFVIVFTLTTPTYALNVLQLNFFNTQKSTMNNVISRFLPSLILWGVSVLLPFLVYYSEILIGHWTKTEEHVSVIWKTYTFLIIMVLILPSLGIASLPSFIKWLIPKDTIIQNSLNATSSSSSILYNQFILHWLCIFAPGNCAFFVNYIITAAFIGTIADLIRIPELIIYLYYQVVVRSSVEMWGIRKNVVYEFQFGLCYSWILCVFAVTVTYSIICPLITPFGLIYMVLKYSVDRYNIYFAYERSFINSKIHRLAMSFTVFAFLLLQVNLLLYLKINKTIDNLIYIFVFISFILSMLLFVVFTFYGWFTQIKTQELNEEDFSQVLAPPTPVMPSLLSTLNWVQLSQESHSGTSK